jgi:hypothetical protein
VRLSRSTRPIGIVLATMALAAGPTSGACSRASNCGIPAHATYHGRTVPLGSCAGLFGVSPTDNISLNVGGSLKVTGSFRETTPRQLAPPLTGPLLAPDSADSRVLVRTHADDDSATFRAKRPGTAPIVIQTVDCVGNETRARVPCTALVVTVNGRRAAPQRHNRADGRRTTCGRSRPSGAMAQSVAGRRRIRGSAKIS